MDETDILARLLALEAKYDTHMAQFEEFKACNVAFREETKQDIKDIKEEQATLNKIANSMEMIAYKTDETSKMVEAISAAQGRLEDGLKQNQEDMDKKFSSQINTFDNRLVKVELSDTNKKAALVDTVLKAGGGMLLGAVLLLLFKLMFPALPF